MATVLLALPAAAQPSLPLSVSRGPGADDCPDAEGLSSRVEQIRKAPAPHEEPAYSVAFTRDEAGLRAEIVHAKTAASRVLTDASPDCSALAQATSVTLALLFDAERQAPPEPQPTPQAAPPPEPVEPTHTARAPALFSTLSLGAGLSVGITAPIASAFVLELGLHTAHARVLIGALFSPAATHDLSPGRVREALYAGSLSACLTPWFSRPYRFDLCASGVLGSVRAQARGFDVNRDASRFYGALALDLRLSHMPDPFGFELAASLLMPLRRQDFAIDNVGIAYESTPVALLLTLRGALGWSYWSYPR